MTGALLTELPPGWLGAKGFHLASRYASTQYVSAMHSTVTVTDYITP